MSWLSDRLGVNVDLINGGIAGELKQDTVIKQDEQIKNAKAKAAQAKALAEQKKMVAEQDALQQQEDTARSARSRFGGRRSLLTGSSLGTGSISLLGGSYA